MLKNFWNFDFLCSSGAEPRGSRIIFMPSSGIRPEDANENDWNLVHCSLNGATIHHCSHSPVAWTPDCLQHLIHFHSLLGSLRKETLLMQWVDKYTNYLIRSNWNSGLALTSQNCVSVIVIIFLSTRLNTAADCEWSKYALCGYWPIPSLNEVLDVWAQLRLIGWVPLGHMHSSRT